MQPLRHHLSSFTPTNAVPVFIGLTCFLLSYATSNIASSTLNGTSTWLGVGSSDALILQWTCGLCAGFFWLIGVGFGIFLALHLIDWIFGHFIFVQPSRLLKGDTSTAQAVTAVVLISAHKALSPFLTVGVAEAAAQNLATWIPTVLLSSRYLFAGQMVQAVHTWQMWWLY